MVRSIEILDTTPTGANAEVRWKVRFSDAVSGVDASDFELVGQPAENSPSVSSVSGSGQEYIVTANTGSGSSGTLALKLVDDGSIKDTSPKTTPLRGSTLPDGSFIGQAYTLIPPVPLLSKEISAPAGVVGDVVTFDVYATNPFAADLYNVEVVDDLPPGMAYVGNSLGDDDPTISIDGQKITWTIPLLPAQTTRHLTISVELTAKGLLENTVTSPGATPSSATLLVLPSAITHFRFDEEADSYNGTPGEAKDSGGTELHGQRWKYTSGASSTNVVAPATPIAAAPPAGVSISGGFCNAAQFDGTAVIEVQDSERFDYKKHLSASAWVYPTQRNESGETDANASILSNDTNYELHLTKDGRIYWWWQDDDAGGDVTLTTTQTVPLNRWTHIAITMNADKAKDNAIIYINGQEAAKRNWRGTLKENNCPFYIGGDIHTTASCESPVQGRSFRGMIDEVKLYSYELSPAEIDVDMRLGRSCSGTFDHLRIEHSGSGSTCGYENVTVKACLDSACTRLYTGDVVAELTPADASWAGGSTMLNFRGGMTSRKITSPTPDAIAIGAINVQPEPFSGTHCYKNGALAEDCAIQFTTVSCAFNVAEPLNATVNPDKSWSGIPNLYTKLAATQFPLSILALSSSIRVNSGFVGKVWVQLRDGATAACGGGTQLARQQVEFKAADGGRKDVNFTVNRASRSVRVLIESDPQACSTDAFAVRPGKFVATSSNATNAGSTNNPKFKAGSDKFTLTATAVPAAGYDGTPQINQSKIVGTAKAGAISGAFPAASAGVATGTQFTYSEVGTFGLQHDALHDGTFTAIDQSGDCIAGNFDNVLSGGRYGCSIGSQEVGVSSGFGRFIPDHFTTTVIPGNVNAGFTYSGQPFAVTVTARNAAGATTQNYAGAYAREVGLADANSATNSSEDWGGFGSSATLSASGFENGVQAAAVTYTYGIKERPPLEDRPGSAPLLIRALENAGDSVSSQDFAEGNTPIRSGRLQLSNAVGSERLPLQVPAVLEYYNGAAWLPDSTLSNNFLQSSSYSDQLRLQDGEGSADLPQPADLLDAAKAASGSVLLALDSGLSQGKITITATPVSGNGYLDFMLNVPEWLQYPWGGSYDNPTARVSFGLYGGNKRIIYRRERH